MLISTNINLILGLHLGTSVIFRLICRQSSCDCLWTIAEGVQNSTNHLSSCFCSANPIPIDTSSYRGMISLVSKYVHMVMFV